MNLVAASKHNDWEQASEILRAVGVRLREKDQVLWPDEQVTPRQLARNYSFEQLHFFELEKKKIGIVFLMNGDHVFWPEAEAGTSMFFHKLAIHPEYWGQGMGNKALELIKAHAITHGFKWLRLDCDDRAPLHRFYSSFGFSLVDIKRMDPFIVARYQLLTIK